MMVINMTKETSKIPNIRFLKYLNVWEICKLKEISERSTKKNSELESTLPLTISAQYGLVDQITYFNKRIASKNITNYYLLEKGDFAYNKSYSKDYPWGVVKRLDGYDKGVLSTLYIVFKPTRVNSDFLLTYYDTNNWHKEVSMRAAEGARNHGLLNITALDFFDTNLFIPVEKEEQKKIGEFFKQLQEAIILQQQLLNDHKQLKKAMLQKMFPQKGESVPRIRFAGFTDDWEIEPLSRLGKIMTGSTPSTLNKDNYSNEGILWITPTDIKGRIVTKTSRQISKMGETGARIAPAGTILVTSIASIGKNTLLLTRAGFNQQINSLTPNKNNDSYFLFTQSKIWSEKMKRVASSGTMQIVNKTEFSSIKTSIPQLEEQIKIGKIFKQLDETIEIYEKKLKTYQELKKAMLQKMFV